MQDTDFCSQAFHNEHIFVLKREFHYEPHGELVDQYWQECIFCHTKLVDGEPDEQPTNMVD